MWRVTYPVTPLLLRLGSMTNANAPDSMDRLPCSSISAISTTTTFPSARPLKAGLRLAAAAGRRSGSGQVQGARAPPPPGADQGAAASWSCSDAGQGTHDHAIPHQTDHICARHAICFQCFRAGVERTRARREAWAQRSLPFEGRAGEAADGQRAGAPASDAGAPGAERAARLVAATYGYQLSARITIELTASTES